MTAARWKAVRLALVLSGFAYLFAAWLRLIPFTLNLGVAPGIDTFAYWTADPIDPYQLSRVGSEGAFLYSPLFAQLFSPLRALPFELVYGLWVAGSVVALWWMRVLWTVAFPPVLLELWAGNVHIFYAAMIVVGFRFGGVWAFAVLTKISPAIGAIWYVGRREWRRLGELAALLALLLIASAVLGGLQSWIDWIGVIRANESPSLNMKSDQYPVLWRTAVAAVVIGLGAVRDVKWSIPVGVVLAMPVIWPGAAAVLVAAVSPRTYDPRPDAATAQDAADDGDS